MLASFAAPRRVAFRANTLVADPDALRAELERDGLAVEPVPWCPGAFLLRDGDLRALQATDAARRGALYVQGLSSQAAPLALDPRPGERVLDLCAAPGSKTAQIAALMRGEGALVANDRSRKRVYRLRAVLAGQHVTDRMDVEVTCAPGARLARSRPDAFDRVLVDAPCTMEGRVRADDPRTFADWGERKIKRLAAQQRGLLRAAITACRPGGVVVYATCTFAPEENEGVVDRVLRREAGAVALEPPPLAVPGARPGTTAWRGRTLDASLALCARLLPDDATEGFFVARFRKRG